MTRNFMTMFTAKAASPHRGEGRAVESMAQPTGVPGPGALNARVGQPKGRRRRLEPSQVRLAEVIVQGRLVLPLLEDVKS